LTVIIRCFLAVVFIVYGLTKLLGGQFNYGDWTLDKKTVDGTSLVWSFYGYSPLYGRFIGLTELIPAIILLIPRTATVGAIALFMVALNVTVMDFAFGFPSVKYFALFYTVLLGFLLWSDRAKLLRLIEPAPSSSQGNAAARSPLLRRAGVAAGVLFLLFTANIFATSLDRGPERAAQQYLQSRLPGASELQLLRSRYTGLLGVGRSALIDFRVTRANITDTVQVQAHKLSGFTPWRMDGSSTAQMQAQPR
jgi:uncharacterized membrane protein YphA (DoxX/SURF4 family)